jgi:hypothetical protein
MVPDSGGVLPSSVARAVKSGLDQANEEEAMKLRRIAVAALLVSATAGSAAACTGELLFADDFSDPVQSKAKWHDDKVVFTKGYMVMKMDYLSGPTVAIPNAEKDFDLCVDVTTPKVKRPKMGAVADIGIDRQDKITYDVELGADSAIVVSRTTEPYELIKERTYPSIKGGAGRKNTLRLLVKGNQAVLFGNGQRLLDFELVDQQLPPRVTLLGQSDDEGDEPWRFSNVKMTRPSRD